MLLFAGFSVIAASWLLLGFWLANRHKAVKGASGPMFPSLPAAPLAGLEDVDGEEDEYDDSFDTTAYDTQTVSSESAELVGRGLLGSRRQVLISSDQPVRVGKTVTTSRGLLVPANVPVTLPYLLAPNDTLRVIRASGTDAVVSVSVRTARRG